MGWGGGGEGRRDTNQRDAGASRVSQYLPAPPIYGHVHAVCLGGRAAVHVHKVSHPGCDRQETTKHGSQPAVTRPFAYVSSLKPTEVVVRHLFEVGGATRARKLGCHCTSRGSRAEEHTSRGSRRVMGTDKRLPNTPEWAGKRRGDTDNERGQGPGAQTSC